MLMAPFAKSKPKSALLERLGLYGAEGERVYSLLYVSILVGANFSMLTSFWRSTKHRSGEID
jgi:hypothetical protein